jgi:hypothetical protein
MCRTCERAQEFESHWLVLTTFILTKTSEASDGAALLVGLILLIRASPPSAGRSARRLRQSLNPLGFRRLLGCPAAAGASTQASTGTRVTPNSLM